MIVLGVESSCDETGLALYDTQQGLLAHALYSQIAMHEEYGGVVPELASRDHIQRTIPLLEQVLRESGVERFTEQFVSTDAIDPHQLRMAA